MGRTQPRLPGAMRLLSAAVYALVGLTVGLAGCETQRTLPTVRLDADLAVQRGDLNTALADYREYVDRDPRDAEARYDLGRVLLQLGRPREAEQQLQTAHDLRPTETRYQDALAEAMRRSGDIEGMLIWLRQLADQDETPAGWIRVAEQAEASGLPDEAERAYRAAAARGGQRNPEPYRELGDFYRRVNNTEAEIAVRRVLLWFDPDDASAAARLRDLGEIPGPSLARPPSSLNLG